jgi:hypothetical protein
MFRIWPSGTGAASVWMLHEAVAGLVFGEPVGAPDRRAIGAP